MSLFKKKTHIQNFQFLNFKYFNFKKNMTDYLGSSYICQGCPEPKITADDLRCFRGHLSTMKCWCRRRNGLQDYCPRQECFVRLLPSFSKNPTQLICIDFFSQHNCCCLTRPSASCTLGNVCWKLENNTMGMIAYPRRRCQSPYNKHRCGDSWFTYVNLTTRRLLVLQVAASKRSNSVLKSVQSLIK